MPDYRSMYDSEYLHHYDLPEGVNEITAEIEKVVAGELVGEKGRKAHKPIVYFKGKQKGLGLNKTNGKIIAKLYGNQVESWTGKRITLYRTTTEMAGETVECLRVRPTVPK